MEVKIGDLIQKRFIIKKIILDPCEDFSPVFILFDKQKESCVDYSKEKMMKLLDIKESD